MFKDARGWRLFAGLSGCVAVAMGAIGAHVASDFAAAALVERASQYALIHALALLYVSNMSGTLARAARWLFLIGTLLFCGALYFKGLTGWPYASKPAPMGGVSFMLGWLALALSGLQANRTRK